MYWNKTIVFTDFGIRVPSIQQEINKKIIHFIKRCQIQVYNSSHIIN